MHWLFVRDKYRPGHDATEKTFMKRITERKLLDIVKGKESLKRRGFYYSVSLDDLLRGKDVRYINKFIKTDDKGHDAFLNSELPQLITTALEKLTLRQKELCRLLSEGKTGMREAGKLLGISSFTLYEEIKRVREIFRKEGLEDYLD